ncbi:MAG: Lrp/AsnC family transcriptional regulator [Anaerolineae bacterium]|jgi:Lrp/AsnC family transcriptional regulator, leucine-responsive regulatory protein|nr:Lrp/AsnC family transcriptional regulator [Anaerolineae bacterium]
MAKSVFDGAFDQLDRAILEELQVNGRISVADLARKIFLSPPAVYQRIKRLERAGMIRQYVALLDYEMAGYDLVAFIRLSLQQHSREQVERVRAALEPLPAVLECYHTAGTHDLLLKVVSSDHKALERFISEHLMTLPGIEKIETSVVLNEIKVTTAVALK